jgi:hypothetical protein
MPRPLAVGGGKASEGRNASWGSPVSWRGGNTANPRIGSRVKQTCTVEEEKPSRW